MEFDSADMASMEASGLLYGVVLHEMGHVLGSGTIWSSRGMLSGAGTSNPIFVGAQATAAYNQIFGLSAAGVPVENTGGGGTRDSHWRDSIFTNELMTGWAGPGTNLPLSRITVGSLADIGYTVNMAAADSYTPSSSQISAARTASGGSTSLRGLLGESAPAVDVAGIESPTSGAINPNARRAEAVSAAAERFDALLADFLANRPLHHDIEPTASCDAVENAEDVSPADLAWEALGADWHDWAALASA
jgi:hypothetical protein